MSSVEIETTNKNIERARNHSELERYAEIEQKLVPTNPLLFQGVFEHMGDEINQSYLSKPGDEFSLRLRAQKNADGAVTHTATLKDRGEIANGGLRRMEVEVTITPEAYTFLKNHHATQELTKIRTTIVPGATVDIYNHPETPVVIEVEHKDPFERACIIDLIEDMTGGRLIDQTDNPNLSSEAIAYRNSPETTKPRESLDAFAERVFSDMLAQYVTGKNQVVVCLTGMSGSGKTTVTRILEERALELLGEEYRPIVISTDDQHFGKQYLEKMYGAPYTDWDSSQTYDTAGLARKIKAAATGIPLEVGHFDFTTQEPVFDGVVEPSPFIIIEGLHAGSKDLDSVRSLHYELPTSIADSVGRDIRRLVIDGRANEAFPTPESRLQYLLEKALPVYFGLEHPKPNAFNASARPLAERALLLTRLQEPQIRGLQG